MRKNTNQIKPNPLKDRINAMQVSADEKLDYLNEYESKYKLTEGAQKNCDKIRIELIAEREIERTNPNYVWR
jgi:hypothetical protein